MAKRKIEVEIVGDSRSLERAFRRSESAGKRFDSSFSRLGRNAGVAIGAAAAGIATLGVASVKSAASFESSIQKIVGLSGVAQGKIAGLTQGILDLAPEVGKGPQELADALLFITSSGIKASKSLDVLKVSAEASAAGLGQTQVVADALTSALNAYGQETLSAKQATDVLVATVREGKGEATDFAGVIGNVTAFASQLGVSFDQVGAALAAMTRLGTSAETATIQLQATFASLAKVTPKAEKAFKSVGLSSDDLLQTLGKPNGLLKFLTKIKSAFGNNTKALVAAFPNIRAVRGLFALVGKQSDEVRGIFDRLSKSTGSLKTAFGAISKTTQEQFAKAKAAAQVAVIQIGALFAPLANVVARGLRAAAEHIANFVGDLRQAKTFSARLDVVIASAKDIARALTRRLRAAIAAIDFRVIWAKARGIADGLQQRLERVDFGFVGERIGKAIRQAVAVAIPAAKDLAARLNAAVKAIDFSGLGRRLGPELATALVSAFVTLTDPAFWIKNWDLALAVAATVFGGAIGKIAGKLAAPFVRLGGELVARFTPVFVEGFSRLPSLLARALVASTKAIAGAIGRLIALVSERFAKLGKITRFAIKVLGIAAAIRAVTNFVRRVVSTFSRVGKAITDAFSFDKLKRRALKAAIEIIEPFTHLPKILGGGTFQKIQKGWEQSLANMEKATREKTRAIQAHIDAIHGKNVAIGIAVVSPGAVGGDRAGGLDVVTKKTKKVTRAVQETVDAIDNSAKVAARVAKQATSAFDKLIAALSLKGQQASLTKSLQDDLAVVNGTIAALKARIKAVGATNDLLSQLADAQIQQKDLTQQINEAKVARVQSRQFKQLGLTATGEARTPSVSALSKRLASVRALVKGSALDPGKTRGQLANIAKVLSGQFGKVGQQVRAAILSMLNDITSALDSTGQAGPLTKTVKRGVDDLVKGLGLTPEQIKAIRQRGTKFTPAIASAGRANTHAIVSPGSIGGDRAGGLELHIYIDGEEVEKRVTRRQQKKRGRRASSRRGTAPGR